MAAITPSATVITNKGTLTEYKLSFTGVNNGDTYEFATTNSAIVDCYANATGAPVQTYEGVGIGWLNDTITFAISTNNRSVDLYVEARQ